MVYIYIDTNHRRKFRSQTSGNMDRWKSRGGKSQRREEQKREEQRRERVRRKKMQVPEKVGKSRNTVFFPMICGSGGSKVGSLKRWVRSHLARWEMKSCTPLWREAHLEVRMYKAHQNTSCSDHFWKLRCPHSEIKSAKNWGVRSTSDVVSRGKCKGLCTLSKVSKSWGFCSSFSYNHYTTTTTTTTTTLHYITLRYITLLYITLHYANYN